MLNLIDVKVNTAGSYQLAAISTAVPGPTQSATFAVSSAVTTTTSITSPVSGGILSTGTTVQGTVVAASGTTTPTGP